MGKLTVDLWPPLCPFGIFLSPSWQEDLDARFCHFPLCWEAVSCPKQQRLTPVKVRSEIILLGKKKELLELLGQRCLVLRKSLFSYTHWPKSAMLQTLLAFYGIKWCEIFKMFCERGFGTPDAFWLQYPKGWWSVELGVPCSSMHPESQSRAAWFDVLWLLESARFAFWKVRELLLALQKGFV